MSQGRRMLEVGFRTWGQGARYPHPRKRLDLTELRSFSILLWFGRGEFLCLWWQEGPLAQPASRRIGSGTGGAEERPEWGASPAKPSKLSARDLKRKL